MKNSQKIERRILITSFMTGLLFVIGEFFAAIISKSQSVLMDAAYDATEVIVIALTLFLTPLFHKPQSEKRPFGYSQVESVFLVIKNFMMISVTIGLLVDTIQVMLNGGNIVDGRFISIFQFILGIISLFVFLIMKKMNKSIISPIIDIELYGWKIDIFYSFGMSIAFLGSNLLTKTSMAGILPYFDQIIAILVVLFMAPQGIKMLINSIKVMFLFPPENEDIDKIRALTTYIISKYNYVLDSCDIYKTGRVLWVDAYINVPEPTMRMSDFNMAAQELQQELTKLYGNCLTEIIIVQD
ncbi:MAG: cation transporter [Anaerovoracaceae bacterium]